MDSRYFRAGAGSVIYNQEGKVAFFKRAYPPIGAWQFQQGGIDIGEDPETTLWRELHEEVGVTEADIMKVDPYPHWTVQVYPVEMTQKADNPYPDRLGQVHRWWFLKLRPEALIDLEKAEDKEFSEWKWVTFDEAIQASHEFRKPVYQELKTFYETLVH